MNGRMAVMPAWRKGPDLVRKTIVLLVSALSFAGRSDKAEAQSLAFSPPIPLNSNAGTDSGDDRGPTLVTDGRGTWIAAWASTDSLNGAIGTDFDLLFARSEDEGATWTPPAALNTNAPTDAGDDTGVRLATDGLGTWVAVWSSNDTLGGAIGSDFDVLYARSTDNGRTWTVPAPLAANSTLDTGDDHAPSAATDGLGVWMVVWWSDDSLGGSLGSDADILVTRSEDYGVTWSPPHAVNTYAFTDNDADLWPSLLSLGAGRWMAVWRARNLQLDGEVRRLDAADIIVASSVDDGLTWGAPKLISDTIDHADNFPHLATDGSGNLVAAWESQLAPMADLDILVATSTNAGITWAGETVLSAESFVDTIDDRIPEVTSGGAGKWVIVWSQSVPLDPLFETDIQISRSTDDGRTWTVPAPLNTNAAFDTALDTNPAMGKASVDRWLAVWASKEPRGGPLGSDFDLLHSIGTVFCSTSSACEDGDPCTNDSCTAMLCERRIVCGAEDAGMDGALAETGADMGAELSSDTSPIDAENEPVDATGSDAGSEDEARDGATGAEPRDMKGCGCAETQAHGRARDLLSLVLVAIARFQPSIMRRRSASARCPSARRASRATI